MSLEFATSSGITRLAVAIEMSILDLASEYSRRFAMALSPSPSGRHSEQNV